MRLGAWPLGLVLFVCVHVGGEGGCRRRRHFSPFLGLVLLFRAYLGVLLVAADGGGRRRGLSFV